MGSDNETVRIKMNKACNLNQIILIIFIIFQTACSTKPFEGVSNSILTDNDNLPYTKRYLQIIENKNIKFTYLLGDTSKFGENILIDVHCLVRNNSSNKIYYLCQSCNGLENYLVLKPSSFKGMSIKNCNASWVMINVLEAGDSINFKTHLLNLKPSEELENVGLNFTMVNEYVPFDTLRKYPKLLSNVYSQNMESENIIWNLK